MPLALDLASPLYKEASAYSHPFFDFEALAAASRTMTGPTPLLLTITTAVTISFRTLRHPRSLQEPIYRGAHSGTGGPRYPESVSDNGYLVIAPEKR